jgi:hypothetical protein
MNAYDITLTIAIAAGKRAFLGWGFATLMLTLDLRTKEDQVARDCAKLENYTPWFMQH